MNPVFFWVWLCFLAGLCNYVMGQSYGSVHLQAWEQLRTVRAAGSSDSHQLSLWIRQPMGVPNLYELALSQCYSRSGRRFGLAYELLRAPGMRTHSLRSEVQILVNERFRLGQGIGLAMHQGRSDDPLSWMLQVRNSCAIGLGESGSLAFEVSDWLGLIWPDSRRLDYFRLRACAATPLSEPLSLGCYAQTGVPETGQLGAALFMRIDPAQELLVAVDFLPFGLGIGYALRQDRLHIRIFINWAALYGWSPQTAFLWGW